MSRPPLTPRQIVILTHVIDAYIAGGHPVGSKTLVELGAVDSVLLEPSDDYTKRLLSDTPSLEAVQS